MFNARGEGFDTREVEEKCTDFSLMPTIFGFFDSADYSGDSVVVLVSGNIVVETV